MFVLYIAITAILIAEAQPAAVAKQATEIYICKDYLECA